MNNTNIACQIIPINTTKLKHIRNKQKPINDVVINVSDPQHIKQTIAGLLFDKKHDNVLLKYNNSLYICEATDHEKQLYNRRVVSYHPLADSFTV
jgi:hypothetical protein